MSRYRANSAGGGSRAGSAGNANENRALREQVSYLQQQLMFSKAESQKVSDQLNCLISLIKRAWTGDKTASVHVANIVGVAPPDIHPEFAPDMGVSVVTKPKSRAINNWAVLTIGVLNREYKIQEREQAAKQRHHLQRRQDYLEEQLLYNRDIQAYLQPRQTRPLSAYHQNGSTHGTIPLVGQTTPQEGHCPSPTEGLNEYPTDQRQHQASHTYGRQHISIPEKISVDKQPSAGMQRKHSGKPLYRKPREAEREPDLIWADLVIEPSTPTSKINKATDLTMDGLYRLPSSYNNGVSNGCHGDGGEEEKDDDRMYIAYDDPQRYTKAAVYDVEGAVGTDALTRRCRPLSGQLSQADSRRARPKSASVAVSGKHERPLKFETTRPISAQTSSNRAKNHRSGSAKSSQKDNKPKQFVSLDRISHTAPGADTQEGPRRSPEERSSRGGPEPDGDGGMPPLTNVFEDLDIAELMKVDVTRPECIEQFDDDLKEMDIMEHNFRRRAVDLQKKLGITAGGMLYPDL